MSSENELRLRAINRKINIFDTENEKLWKGPFIFIHGADTQFGMIESYIENKPNAGWEPEIKLTTQAIQAANRMKPKPRFFVVCGDLVDAMPEFPLLKEAQIKDFKEVFWQLDPEIPLICVCGNHDVGNTPTQKTIAEYKDKFGDDYFSFICGGVKFIVLNSQYYEDSSLVMELADEQQVWLDAELKNSSSFKYIIIFQHIPWFLKSPMEEKEYFNIENELRLKMLKKFKEYGVNGIFCGHYHRNAGGYYENIELVVTSAIGAQMGNDKSGMRVVKILDSDIKHDYYDFDHVPENIPLE